MKKGIIMEINKDFLTLLTPDGEFLRALNHNSQYQIGQEIDFFPVVQEEGKKSFLFDFLKSFKVKAVFSVALLFVFIVGTMFSSFGKDKVYAYMSIDVNPSIELGINEKFQVIEILPYNEEGKQVIANIHDWKKKNVHVLTSEIVREMKEQGFIKDNHAVLLSTVPEKEEVQLEENNRWKKEMAEIEEIIQNENLELKVVEGSKEDRAMAIEKGITTGQYKENQLNANRSTSQIKEKTESIESSKIENENEDKLGQVKKGEAEEKENSEKQVPPGQAKKNENSEKQVPPGQAKKNENSEKQVPPGQAKKNENSEKQVPPGQAKKNENSEKQVPPGQAKKNENSEKQVPPGQAKKNENSEKQVPPGQAKKNENGEKQVPPGQAKKNENSE